MLRKTETLSRLLLTTLVASVIGCQADSPKSTSDPIVGPTAPVSLQVRLTSNKSSLTADGEASATLTATCSKDGSLIADLTPVTISTSLGSFDSPGGANSVELLTINGRVTTTLFPGSVEGVARLTANCLGAIGIANVTIKPAVEVVEPPVASVLSISTDTSSVSDFAAPDPDVVTVTATVVGSDAKPFKNAPVQFSAPTGAFDSSGGTVGDIRATNSAGQASDTLRVSDAELALLGETFDITATLFTEGGGSQSVTATITVQHAPTAQTIDLILTPDSTVADDGTVQNATLRATVTDNNAQPLQGVSVTFSTALGLLDSTTDVTDVNGVASVNLTLQATDLSNYCLPTFNTTASIPADTDTEVVTISRTPLVAQFTYSAVSVNDVSFTDTTTGGPDQWEWDFDNDGLTDLTTQSPPNVDLATYGFLAGDTKTVKLTARRGVCTSDVGLQSVTVP